MIDSTERIEERERVCIHCRLVMKWSRLPVIYSEWYWHGHCIWFQLKSINSIASRRSWYFNRDCFATTHALLLLCFRLLSCLLFAVQISRHSFGILIPCIMILWHVLRRDLFIIVQSLHALLAIIFICYHVDLWCFPLSYTVHVLIQMSTG